MSLLLKSHIVSALSFISTLEQELLIPSSKNGYISVTEVAEETKLSRSSVEILTSKFKKEGVVLTKMGPNGGIKLARPISMAKCIRLIIGQSSKIPSCSKHLDEHLLHTMDSFSPLLVHMDSYWETQNEN